MGARWRVAVTVATSLIAPTLAIAQTVPRPHVDSLIQSAGPAWSRLESSHFVVYNEARGAKAQSLVDSLEAAWTHALALLGKPIHDQSAITVFVTTSRTRFPRLMSPVTKGLTTMTGDGRDLIVLVQNDSVRAYTRHEVMHALVKRAWGSGPRSNAAWFGEGLATFADGTCRNLPLSVIARDLLRSQPTMTVARLRAEFLQLHSTTRAAAYVFAGSLVEYLWTARGRDGVERLWRESDSLMTYPSSPALQALPNARSVVDREWRAYVEREASDRVGIPVNDLERLGCG